MRCPPAKRQRMISELRKEQEEKLKVSTKFFLEKKKAATDILESLPCYQRIEENGHSVANNAYNSWHIFNNEIRSGEKQSGEKIKQKVVDMSQKNMSFDLQSKEWKCHESFSTRHSFGDSIVMDQVDSNVSRKEGISTQNRMNECNGQQSMFDDFDDLDNNDCVTFSDDEGFESDSQSSTDSLYDNAQMSSNFNSENGDKSASTSSDTTWSSTSSNALFIGQSKIHLNTFHLSSRYKTYIELATILSSINAPGHVYKSIYNWAQKASEEDLQNPIQYKTLVTQLGKMSGLYETLPKTSILPLPSGNAIKITKFGFSAQLLSLLNDEDLMSPENLIFGDDIFKRFPTPTESVNDIHESMWYSRTQQDLCKRSTDVLCPLIIYIDKTFVKGKGIEPISFTLGKEVSFIFLTLLHFILYNFFCYTGIFNRSTRNCPMAWRNLGLIPGKLGSMVPKIKIKSGTLGSTRLNDWHHVVKHVLEDLDTMQKHECLFWKYKNNNVRLHIPTMFIIGDIEGHDKVCSRKSGHSNFMNGVTHSCDIKRANCDNPMAKCTLFTKFAVQSLQEKIGNEALGTNEMEITIKKLDDMGFYSNVKNAFFKMDFGSNPNGLHGAVAICLLHTFKQKFPNLMVQEYLNIFGVSEDTSGSLQVNSSLPLFMLLCKHQSDRDFPKLNTFSFSLTKGKHSYFANEKYARIFALYLFSVTTYGWSFMMKNRRKGTYDELDVINIVRCIEKTLTIYQFLYQESFSLSDVKQGQSEVEKYMCLLKSCLEKGRTEKDKELDKPVAKFPKFHYLKHIIPMIVEYGSARNFDGGPSESHHKYLSKAPGSRTQGRDDTFDEQTSYNLSAQIILEQIARKSKLFSGTRSGSLPSMSKSKNHDEINVHQSSSSFILHYDIERDTIECRWKKGLVQPTSTFKESICDYIKKELFTSQHGVSHYYIKGFTDLNWKGNIIRAHPCYRSEKSWNDFVNMRWEGKKDNEFYSCPAKVLMWLDMRENTFQTDYYKPGIYAVIHSTQTQKNKYVPTKDALGRHRMRGGSNILRFWQMEPNFWIVPVKAINSLAFVVPDCDDDLMLNETGYYIEVMERKLWGESHK